MHMWHHVTNHLIISNDKDSNSENRINYASVTSSWSSLGVALHLVTPCACTALVGESSSFRKQQGRRLIRVIWRTPAIPLAGEGKQGRMIPPPDVVSEGNGRASSASNIHVISDTSFKVPLGQRVCPREDMQRRVGGRLRRTNA
jgi:hypothetical protein